MHKHKQKPGPNENVIQGNSFFIKPLEITNLKIDIQTPIAEINTVADPKNTRQILGDLGTVEQPSELMTFINKHPHFFNNLTTNKPAQIRIPKPPAQNPGADGENKGFTMSK